MNVEDLSLKERLLLCARAEQQCARHFRDLHGRLRPGDDRLRSLLVCLAEEEERHAAAADRRQEQAPWPAVWHLNEPAMRQMIQQEFPAFGAVPDGTALEAPPVMQSVQAVEEQSVRFYRRMAEHAPDEESREFFRRVVEAESAHLCALYGTPS